MKKTFIVLALAAALAGCSSLKDRLDKVEDGVSNLETRISDLEERLKTARLCLLLCSMFQPTAGQFQLILPYPSAHMTLFMEPDSLITAMNTL